jgi:NhaA family Na+:H+ antiporter
LAVVAWYATYRSGVHATIAGVALALAIPARPRAPTGNAREPVSPTEHLEDLLHPATSFVVLPVFALANAGVELRSGMLAGSTATAIAVGVALGLVVGKLVGIMAGAWLAVRFRVAALPADIGWAHLAGAAALGGIGFTVSLFITGLAFTEPAHTDAARLSVLAASTAAALLGTAILLRAAHTRRRGDP